MIDSKIPWAVLRDLYINSNYQLNYITLSDKYVVFIDERLYSHIFIETSRNTEQIDFEDNYKNSANLVRKYNQYTAQGRLKVDAELVSISTGALSQYPSKLRHLDINVTNGGVARGTTITDASLVDVFSYTGSGSIMSFFLNLEYNAGWKVRLLIDNEDVFGSNGVLTDDFTSMSIYNMSGNDADNFINVLGFYFKSNGNFIWSSPLNTPTRYNTSITIKLKRNTGSGSKKFQAGIVTLTQET